MLTTNQDYDKVLKELASYTKLECDWDGDGACKPETSVILSAMDFANILQSKGLPAPKAMLSGNGEVGLYYDCGTAFLDIGFEEKNHFSYYATNFSDIRMGEEDLPIVKDKLPDKLDNFLKNYCKYIEKVGS